MYYLNLGCGCHFHPDWTNVDFVSRGQGVLAHNLRQGIPFPDASFDVVYHSHLLEHFSKAEAERFLQECYRVLRPNGTIRVVVPDLEQIVRLYLQALEKVSNGSEQWAANYNWLLLELYDQTVRNCSGGEMAAYLAQAHIPNKDFVIERVGKEAENLISFLRQHQGQPLAPSQPLSERETLLKMLLGDVDYTALQIGRFRQSGENHQWMYDQYSLKVLLERVGFVKTNVCTAGESTIPNFEIYGLEVEPDGRTRKPDSLFVEAKKTDQLVNYAPVSPERVDLPLEFDELPSVQALRQTIRQLEAKLNRSQRKLQQVEAKFQESQGMITAMKSSKFWKLRSQWFRLKKLLGLYVEEQESVMPALGIPVRSPLTGSDQVTLIQEFDCQKLIQDWQNFLQIDITEELRDQDKIYLYECKQTNLRFFVPTTVTGSSGLYEQLEKFDWYYMADKWEYRTALRDLQNFQRGNKKLIEIGCGRGYFLEQVKQIGFAAQGLEWNSKAIAIAQSKNLLVESSTSAEAINRYGCNFDVVCSFQVLEHTPDPKGFLIESLQLLKVGGLLILSVPNADSYLKYEYNLLDLPPHHMLRWYRTTFKSLEQMFSIRVRKIQYEPLAEYHVSGYLNAHSENIRSLSPVGRLLFNSKTLPVYGKLLGTGLRSYFRGHTLYVVFEKTA